jgi:hypothetical protein
MANIALKTVMTNAASAGRGMIQKGKETATSSMEGKLQEAVNDKMEDGLKNTVQDAMHGKPPGEDGKPPGEDGKPPGEDGKPPGEDGKPPSEEKPPPEEEKPPDAAKVKTESATKPSKPPNTAGHTSLGDLTKSTSDYSYQKGTSHIVSNDDNNNHGEMIENVLDIGYKLLVYGTYIADIVITIICIVNVLILVIMVIKYMVETNENNMMLRDTLKFKLLDYVTLITKQDNDGNYHVSSSSSQVPGLTDPITQPIEAAKQMESKPYLKNEPIFFINMINLVITIVIILYICFTGLLFLLGVIIFVLWIIGIFFGSTMKLKLRDPEGKLIMGKYITLSVFISGFFCLIIFGLYKFIFRDRILSHYITVASSIHQVDRKVLNNLPGSTNKELVACLISSKGLSDKYVDINNYLVKKYSTAGTNDIDNFRKELYFITVYLHLDANITAPGMFDTAMEKYKFIGRYFFKNPTQLDNKIPNFELRNTLDAKSDGAPVQYVGLLPATTGIIRVSKIYRTAPEFKELRSLINNSVEEAFTRTDQYIDNLNNALLSIPEFKNMIMYIGMYMLLILFVSLISLIVHSVVIMKDDARHPSRDSFGLSSLASVVVGIIGYGFAPMNEVIIAAMDSTKYAICTQVGNDPSRPPGEKARCFAQATATMNGNDQGFYNQYGQYGQNDQYGQYDQYGFQDQYGQYGQNGYHDQYSSYYNR